MPTKLVVPKDSTSGAARMERRINSRVIGQPRPVREITRGMHRAFSGLKDPDAPIATLAFFGPTGTGKTLTAEELANCWPKSKVWRCLRYSECRFQITEEETKAGMRVPPHCPKHSSMGMQIPLPQQEIPNIWVIDCGGLGGSLDHAVTTLIGAPPSYIGYNDPPKFTGKAPRVVLFDEAEKALLTKNWGGGQSTFANILLKILDKGRITNNLGEEINFTKSIIILTGNLGAAEILREFEGSQFGFLSAINHTKSIAKMLDEEVKRLNNRVYGIVKGKAERELAPEFLNRLDRLVVFHFLTQSDYRKIFDLEFVKVKDRIARIRTPFKISLTDGAKEFLLMEALSDRRFGARPLVRIIKKNVETALSELLNNDLIDKEDELEGRFENGDIAFYRLNERVENINPKEVENAKQQL